MSGAAGRPSAIVREAPPQGHTLGLRRRGGAPWWRRSRASLCGAGCAVALLVAASGSAGAATAPQLSARSAILVEPSTGQRLYGYNVYRELPIASATKLMTALVTLEHEPHLGRLLTDPNYYPAAVDSQIGLHPGERMTVHDLLLALMLPSADDAAQDLAYNVGHGSVQRFIGMMNARARRLGLRHTHYSTPIGLDTPGNYSTATDLVSLANYDLTHSRFFARIVALSHAVLHSGNYVRYVVNRNDLVGTVPWINGVKTGHTAAAGYVLVASGHRDAMTLLSAVLGTPSQAARDASTLALLDYGFANFRLVEPIRAGEVLARPTIRDRTGARAELIAAATFRRVEPRRIGLRILIQAPRQLTGPLRRHAVLGTAIVLAGHRVLDRVALLLARALPAVSTLAIASRFITRPLILLAIAVLAVTATGLALALLARRRRAPGAGGGLETA